CQHYYRTPCSF
nr:immunoglobulin light chain junction region [Macaca mulatta]